MRRVRLHKIVVACSSLVHWKNNQSLKVMGFMPRDELRVKFAMEGLRRGVRGYSVESTYLGVTAGKRVEACTVISRSQLCSHCTEFEWEWLVGVKYALLS